MKKMGTQRVGEQPEPLSPGITKALVRKHAGRLYRDKALELCPLTEEDWLLVEEDLLHELHTNKSTAEGLRQKRPDLERRGVGEEVEPVPAESSGSDSGAQGFAHWQWAVEEIERRANTVTALLEGILRHPGH